MKTNVTVRIMESDFQLLCDVDEKELLIKGAEQLNQHLKAFRRSNPGIDAEKGVVMGALRATCELINAVETLSDQAVVANAEVQKALTGLE